LKKLAEAVLINHTEFYESPSRGNLSAGGEVRSSCQLDRPE
jgi:hypothetical protein